MKISYNWLKDFIDIKKSPEKLANDLSLFGHEAEHIEKLNSDTIFDLEITPNRGDCLSVLGIAREISALYNIKLKKDKLKFNIKESVLDKNIKLEVLDKNLCPRYTARIIENIEIKPSPKWLQQRLKSYGFRPINNIVDATNYVMIATGQPLHAFDYNKIKTNGRDVLMRLRPAKKGEEIMTLDGKNYVLPDGALIIENNDKIYDLAGIMGGFASAVDKNTKCIILQAAIFDPKNIRATSQFLGLVTDASYRYERGVDFENTTLGIDMVASLISNSCSKAKVGLLYDNQLTKQSKKEIIYDPNKINELLGTSISPHNMMEYLKRLGFTSFVPSYRSYDVSIWQDLAEEVARIYSYSKINKKQFTKNLNKKADKTYLLSNALKNFFSTHGFTEVYSYSFTSKELLNKLNLFDKNILEIKKPLSPETKFLRPQLLPSLLLQISKNPWAPEINMFEIGNCFSGKKEFKQILLASSTHIEKDFHELMKKLQQDFNANKFNYKIFNISQNILNFLKIRKKITFCLIDFNDLLDRTKNIIFYEHKISGNKYRKISSFAPTIFDLAFIVEKSVNAQEIINEIQKIDSKIFLVELFDEFVSEKFGKNKKNIAYHIWLQDLKAPINENNTQQIIKKVTLKIISKYKAKWRHR